MEHEIYSFSVVAIGAGLFVCVVAVLSTVLKWVLK